MMRIPKLYGPDGVPLDGPRTTAAAWADQLAPMRVYLTGPRIHPLDIALVAMYRNAAADEGARYSEAVRGARALRHDSGLHMRARAHWIESHHGIPAGWLAR